MATDRIVLVDGARTAVGRFRGQFKSIPAHQLGAVAVAGALRRAQVDPVTVTEVVMGCIGQIGPDAYNARRVALAAGLPDGIPAYNVNRLCGSGLQAIWSASQQLRCGDADVVVAGGNESMSGLPDYAARSDGSQGGSMQQVGSTIMLTDPSIGLHMGATAENVAQQYGISRQAQDEYALESQRRAQSVYARAAFGDEIVEVTDAAGVGFSTDQAPRPKTTIGSLARLSPAFVEGGTVTAGNSSGMNDGAAAVILMRESSLADRGLSGLVAVESFAAAAMAPSLMGYAPVLALEKLFAQTGTRPRDIDVFEINEAFAAQVIPVIRDAGLDPTRINPYGGAIALGHPMGATGTILALRVAKHLARSGGTYGVVTTCIGGGQAIAALFRRI